MKKFNVKKVSIFLVYLIAKSMMCEKSVNGKHVEMLCCDDLGFVYKK